MQKLIAGYRRFQKDVFPEQRHHFKLLANSQSPHTLFITCSDSRIEPSMITQSEPGDLFLCRVVGNLVPSHGSAFGGVSSAVEYAATVLGVENIVVCGHSDCGAMRAFLHPEKLEKLKAVSAWLEHAASAISVAKELYSGLEDSAFLEMLTKENVVSQLGHLATHPSVASRLRRRNLQVLGWYYDIESGKVQQYDPERKSFVLLDDAFDENGQPISEQHTVTA